MSNGRNSTLAERFSQQNQRVRPSSKEDQVVQKAKEHFERTLIPIAGSLAGSVAALQRPSADEALNYGEIFLRDNVPVMVYLLTQKRFKIVKQFLQICLDLQSTTYQTRGVFPTSFVEENGELIAPCTLVVGARRADAQAAPTKIVDLETEVRWR